jgi:hypothetical protein
MNLMQFIGGECANHRDDGSCLGMPVLLTKDSKMFPAAKCRVAEKKRCAYFEKCVLPLATQRGEPPVLRQYGQLAATPELATSIRYCDCGAPMSKTARMCESCRLRNRRKTFRESANKHRRLAVNS